MTENIDYIYVARESLKNLNVHHTGVSSYGCVSLDGQVFTKLNYACHAVCQQEMSAHKAHIMWSVTGNARKRSLMDDFEPLSLEERSIYFLWLCNPKSPFSDVLCNKYNTDPEYVATHGVIIDNLSAPRNLMVGALAATRACLEHPTHIRLFVKLIKAGIRGDFAFFLAGMARQDQSDRVFYGMVTNSNHWPLWPMVADENYILNFLRGVSEMGKPFNQYDGKSVSIGGAWFTGGKTPVEKYSYYVEDFRVKANSSIDRSSFSGMNFSEYKDFIEAAKQEQERLYALIA